MRSRLNTLMKRRSLLADARDSKYAFSPQDIALGIELNLRGFNEVPREEILEVTEGFVHIRVGKCEARIPEKYFRPGEMPYIYNEIFAPLAQNPHAYENGDLQIEPGDYIVDAGACEGFFIKYSLQRGAKKVVAFEPLSGLAAGLCLTYESEIDAGRVTIISKGLSAKEELVSFDHGNDFLSEAKMNPSGDEACQLTFLDRVVDEGTIPRVDFIKMDIEGAELLAVEGARKIIEEFKPRLSVAVYHAYENAGILRDMLLEYRPDYQVNFGGCYTFEKPYRPFMLYAY